MSTLDRSTSEGRRAQDEADRIDAPSRPAGDLHPAHRDDDEMNIDGSMPGAMAEVTDAELAAVVDDRDLSAAERLAISRERMRRAMQSPRAARRAIAGPGATSENAIVRQLQRVPGMTVLTEAAESWWMRHPLRTAVAVAGKASGLVVGPIAQRNPVKLVLVALAAGGLMALMRPWRWLLKRALFAGLVPQVVSRVVAHLPIESWIALADGVHRRGSGPAAGPAKRK